MMRLGIDASNIRGGGGITYLLELLRTANPNEYGFEQVIVYAGSFTLQQLEDRPWLCKIHDPLIDLPLPYRLYWQRLKLDHLLSQSACDILFSPGASYCGSFRPYVTMSLNMLPFVWNEAKRYGISWHLVKFLLLRLSQLSAFNRSDAVIFPSEYAKATVSKFINQSELLLKVIYAGVDERFRSNPKIQKPISCYTNENPFRLLYVSAVAPYKHQWHIMEAVHKLRKKGLPVMLEIIGGIRNCKGRFYNALSRLDPDQLWIKYRGEIPFKELHSSYRQADMFIFASSCEAGGSFIQLEAMSAGLPIACSDRGSMPEVQGEAGVYFDPENPDKIAEAILSLALKPQLRSDKAWAAFERSKYYSWERCSSNIFKLLSEIAHEGHE
ncbi:MAG: glycosyltransferase family 4 protein [Deltaproteobacteria bacterium]|jgi:glycosyltransferase involved in cell wall biosynthesis|nr:glycosyltransferase family 4 protein [Deltaproteobacteria bacterium]